MADAGTMKAKIEKANEKAGATITIKAGKDVTRLEDAEMAGLLNQGYEVCLEGKELDVALKSVKDYAAAIAKAYRGKHGTVTIKTEITVCKITFGYECAVAEENVAELRRILGAGRFKDMVREKTSWTGNSALIELAADADKGKAVRGLVAIREKAPAISFAAVEQGDGI